MPEGNAMKAHTEEERTTLRSILSRGGHPYKECPCGWFYSGPTCPDKCAEWKKANGTKRVKLYVSGDTDDEWNRGKEFGLEGEALDNFSRWNYELEFDAEVNLETGDVRLLTVDGHKIFPVKG